MLLAYLSAAAILPKFSSKALPHLCRLTAAIVQVVDMPGHNSSLFVLGVMILWFGWYGFNPGSQLAIIDNSQVVANAAVTTTIAPAVASLSAVLTKTLLGKLSTGAALVIAGRVLACAWESHTRINENF